MSLASATSSAISFLVKIRRNNSAPSNRRVPTRKGRVLYQRAVAPAHKLRKRGIHIVNLRNRNGQLILRSRRRQGLRTLIRSVVGDDIRSSHTRPINSVIRRRITTYHVARQGRQAIIGLFNPHRRNLRRPEAKLIRSFFVRVFKAGNQRGVRTIIHRYRNVRRRSTATYTFRQARLLGRASIYNFHVTRQRGRIDNAASNRIARKGRPRVTRRSTRHLKFTYRQLRFNARTYTRYINRRRSRGSVTKEGRNGANNALHGRARRFVGLQLTKFRRAEERGQRATHFRAIRSRLANDQLNNRVVTGEAVSLKFGRYKRTQHATEQNDVRLSVERHISRLLSTFTNCHHTINSRRRLLRTTSSKRRLSDKGIHTHVRGHRVDRRAQLNRYNRHAQHNRRGQLNHNRGLQVVATGPTRQRANTPYRRNIRLINFLDTKRRRITRTTRKFLQRRQSSKTRILRVSLHGTIKYNLRHNAVLIKSSNKQARGILGRNNPPNRLRFTTRLLRTRSTDIRVNSRFIRSNENRFLLRRTALQRNIRYLTVVRRYFRTYFRLLRVNNFRVTADKYNKGRNVRHNRVTSRHLLNKSSLIRLTKRRQPATIERRLVPLLPLLNSCLRHFIRILSLHTSTRRVLNFLSITTTLPRSRQHTLNLTLTLQLNNLSRKTSISLRGLQLRRIGRSSRVLRGHGLALPLTNNKEGQRSTNLRNTYRLLANNKRRTARRVIRTLMNNCYLFFDNSKHLMPYNIFQTSNMFTRLTNTFRLTSPYIGVINSTRNA